MTDNQILKCLRGVAAKLTGDYELQKDLVQEMFVHLIREQVASPGKSLSWYLKSCEFRARNYLRLGRSIDSLKRAYNGGVWGVDYPEDTAEHNAATGGCRPAGLDLQGQMITDDIVNLLLPRLSDRQQQVLYMLLKGFGVREIGRAIGISHPAVIKHRKRIAKIAAELLATQQPASPAQQMETAHPNYAPPQVTVHE